MDNSANTSNINSTVNSPDSNNNSDNLNNSQRKEEINKEIKSYIRKRHPFSIRNFLSKLTKPFRKKEITKEKIEDTIIENPVQRIEVYEADAEKNEKSAEEYETSAELRNEKISGQISEQISEQGEQQKISKQTNEQQQKKTFFFGLSKLFKKRAEDKEKLKEESEYESGLEGKTEEQNTGHKSEEQEKDIRDSLKITVEAIKMIPRENFESFKKTEYFERYKKLLQKYEIKKL